MRKFCLAFIVLTVLAFTFGCSILFPDVAKLGDEYYQSIKTKNYQQVVDLYSDEYFDKIPKEDALRLLEMVNSKLVVYQFEINNWGWVIDNA